ncbi:MAG: DUF928 domain-containing protein [Kovacikia sp.]
MHQLQWLRNPFFRGSTPFLIILGLSLGMSSVALAAYHPPPGSSRPTGSSSSTGTRGGCGIEEPTNLTILAPQGHLGQTASTQPTVAWFVPAQNSYPLEVALFEENGGQRDQLIHIFRGIKSSPGMMQLSLAERSVQLETGKTYRWQVAVLCNPNRPATAQIAKARMKVVALPATLKTQLAQTRDRLKQANLYAEAGFWYDAFAETLAVAKSQPLIGLLKDLISLESGEPKQQLQQILAIEQREPEKATHATP